MQKLELTWIGKGQEPAVEPRILLQDPSRDYGDPAADNMLIHGDNLLALKALEKKEAAEEYCRAATEFNSENDGKPWRYLLISHDDIRPNSSFAHLAKQAPYIQQKLD